MSAFQWALTVLVASVVLIVGKVALDLMNKEIQGRLFDLPLAILRLARWRLPAELREELYEDELLEHELRTILLQEKKPVTALCQGLAFSIGCVRGARRNARAAGWKPDRHRRLPFRKTPSAQRKTVLGHTRRVPPHTMPRMILTSVAMFAATILYVSNPHSSAFPDWGMILMCVFGISINVIEIAVTILRTHLRWKQQRAKALQVAVARHCALVLSATSRQRLSSGE